MTYQRQNSAQIPGGQGGGQDRQYVGKGKWIDFKNGGGKFRIALTPEGIELICRNQNSSGCPDLRLTYSIIVDYGKKKTVYVLCCFHNGRKEHEYKKEKLFGVA